MAFAIVMWNGQHLTPVPFKYKSDAMEVLIRGRIEGPIVEVTKKGEEA